ncbi:hypothetical protein M441DRAFT_245473 [Trichoderma asperellum CBS 433.97]|uniref:Uncharacterized protein n=1 Tax=Trichoderma asperellum (strain ATCC 204424 / CBS 433.97 / NBRC 101777) TaxID=1042311 RepID=A0A2T3YZN2_TRIA4|nr:hypothetical protein M441DRAFT_245473 [Trichoderma asperellum CBS 433.97]PTB38029.1 hypothetical protein M441DRAFT_245473 [Trichoderma asperellum CBS 433.97]
MLVYASRTSPVSDTIMQHTSSMDVLARCHACLLALLSTLQSLILFGSVMWSIAIFLFFVFLFNSPVGIYCYVPLFFKNSPRYKHPRHHHICYVQNRQLPRINRTVYSRYYYIFLHPQQWYYPA